MKPPRIAIIVILVAVASGAWWLMRGPEGQPTGLVASGTVEATEADLGFEMPGRVHRIAGQEGDQVDSGAELALLDLAELQASLQSAEAQHEAARARLTEMERGSRPEEIARAQAAVRGATERVEQAARDLERIRRLHDGGAVSRQALEQAGTAHEVAQADLEQAREKLALIRQGPREEQIQAQRAMARQADAAAARVRAAIRGATITAPFAGLITERHREPGEAVGAGAPILTLRDLSDRWVRIYIPEDRIGRVSVGQSAEIETDSYPGRSYPGRVFFIGSEAEFTPRNVQTTEERTKLVYPVKVRILEDPDLDLKPGIPVDVRLTEEGA